MAEYHRPVADALPACRQGQTGIRDLPATHTQSYKRHTIRAVEASLVLALWGEGLAPAGGYQERRANAFAPPHLPAHWEIGRREAAGVRTLIERSSEIIP